MNRHKFLLWVPVVAAAAIWGFAFSFQSQAAKSLDPLTVNGIRFLLGGLILYVVASVWERKLSSRPLKNSWSDRSLLKASFVVGSLLAISMGLQQAGMETSTAGNGGFITNMDVIILPLIATVFQKIRINTTTWLAVGLSVVGLFLVSFSNSRFVFGDLIMLGVALTVALRALALGKYVAQFDTLKITVYMFLVVGFISSFLAFIFERHTFSFGQMLSAGVPLLYLAVLSTVVAFTLETVSYNRLDPLRISLVVNLEAIFAAIGGWIILNELVSLRTGVGFAILFMAIVTTTVTYKPKHQ